VSADAGVIIVAAARFLRAWTAASQGDDPLCLLSPAVLEAHDAARELVSATQTTDLRAAYGVVDALVGELTSQNSQLTTRN
jgi:hypothetical protein